MQIDCSCLLCFSELHVVAACVAVKSRPLRLLFGRTSGDCWPDLFCRYFMSLKAQKV